MNATILIPARNEEKLLPGCLQSVESAATGFPGKVEVVVILNRCTDRTEDIAREAGAILARCDEKNLSCIRNTGARAASGDLLVTLDADSRMHPDMLRVVHERLASGRYVGGGVGIRPERISLGIILSALPLLPYVLWHGISCGAFWCKREDFFAIGGFDETLYSAEDIDFAHRLKAHGKATGRKFGTLARTPITTSCRKFDIFGDWFVVKKLFTDRDLFRRLFRGKDPDAANRFWYDVKR